MMKVGIIGTGAMGSGIAQVAAKAGHSVLLFDTRPEAIQKALSESETSFGKLAEKGKISAAEAESTIRRIEAADELEALRDCGLIIEAAAERLDIKQAIFSRLDAVTDQDTILASNTSSLSITSIAASCSKPGRVIGIHFFNPAAIMQLVEIIPAVQTHNATTAAARSIIDSWGKTTVLAKDTPGFIVNRIARPFYGEAIRILEEGIADCATIDFAMTSLGGFKMGPFELMDYIGHDVNYTVTETVFQAFFFDPRYKPSFTQKRLLEAGFLGRKSGRGFYAYGPEAERPLPAQDPRKLRDIFERILAMLINEAADALFLGVAGREDIDLAMQKGTNYPQGLLAWADDMGIAYIVSILHGLYAEYQEDRYRCSALLQRMARNYEQFY